MSEPAIIGSLCAVLVGKAQAFTREGSRSAIAKRIVDGPIAVGPLGVEGDEQADRRVHGGPDKAVHCYCLGHYESWKSELPGAGAEWLLAQGPGAFGENFSVDACLTEAEVCIGDQWGIGSAVFEVSQGRQPCWKLNDRFGVPDMAKRVQDSTRAGWYMRVLQPGHVQAGDAIRLLARPHPNGDLAHLLRTIATRDRDRQTIESILSLPLTPSWRKLFQGRLDNGRIEQWKARLWGR